MASLFSRIVAGEIPCHKVYEDERHIAFLDISPIQPGHVLVVPKREVGYLFDMDPAEQEALWRAVRIVERGVRKATDARRVCLMVVGWEVPHVHVHLIPTKKVEDFPIPPKLSTTPKELERLAVRIRQALVAATGDAPRKPGP